MKRMLPIAAALLVLGLPRAGGAQGFDAVGTRAAGMGGAFVAVADDASAAYWNPAGFASGSYFSLALDFGDSGTTPDDRLTAGSRSGFLLAFGAPALGVSYYRLRAARLEPTAGPAADRNLTGAAEVRVNSLTTHHLGATLVQSIVEGVAMGATVKLVRGIAGSGVAVGGDTERLLDDASDAAGFASTKFDADLGVMASGGRLKAGLTVRNLTEPEFETPGRTTRLRLYRQARAGVAVSPIDGWSISADFDLNATPGAHGDVRDIAVGAEGRIVRRVLVRAGTRMNTADTELGRMPTAGFGGSYAVMGSVYVDAQVTLGSDRAPRGWGVSARFVY